MLNARFIAAGLVFGATAASAADFPPYEAVYELRLTRASATFGPRAAVGQYNYRVAETCDGWETKSHIIVDLTFRDDQTHTNERFFLSWEAKNAASYRFAVQTVKNGNTVEAFKGTAAVSAKGGRRFTSRWARRRKARSSRRSRCRCRPARCCRWRMPGHFCNTRKKATPCFAAWC